MDSAVDVAARIRMLEERLDVLTQAARAFCDVTAEPEHLLAQTLGKCLSAGCVVKLLAPGGLLSPAATHLPAEQAPVPHDLTAARRVIETGEAFFSPTALRVPLRVRGETTGVVSLWREAPAFEQEDLVLARAVADHAALAISNARLLQAARRAKATQEMVTEVAHDLNNTLSVILTYAEVLAGEPAAHALRAEVNEIKLAGERACVLAARLDPD